MNIPYKNLLPSNFSGYAMLVLIWLCVGFSLGTALLLGPIRLWVNFARANELSSSTENFIVILSILCLFIISFSISVKLFYWQLLSDHSWAKNAVIGFPILFATIAIWLFMHPSVINNTELSDNVAARFTVGPYPTEEKIKELKAQGYTTIVSLLHPAVVPFEPSLLKDEELAASKYNLEIIKAPMLPWVGDNENSLKVIRNIVINGKGKYYFHCYLGKDRVNVVKNLITSLQENVTTDETNTARTFETQGTFERGEIYKIDSAVYLTPFPTDEELLSFFLAGNVKTVININDSTSSDAKPWMIKEMAALKSMNIFFRQIPVTDTSSDKNISALLNIIDTMAKPVVIHQWNTTSAESIFFRKCYFNKNRFKQINLATKDAATY